MPVDPQISLETKVPAPGGILGGGGSNPLSMIETFAQTQNMLNQNRLFQQTFAARKKAGQIIAGAPDLDSAFTALQRDPLVAPFAGNIMNEYRQMALTTLQMQGEAAKQTQTGLQDYSKSLAGIATSSSPSSWMANHQSQVAAMSPAARTALAGPGGPLDSIRDSMIGGLDKLPGGINGPAAMAEFQKRMFAQSIATGGLSQEGVRGISGALPPQVLTGPYGPGGAQTPVQVGGPAVGGSGQGLQIGSGGPSMGPTSTPGVNALGGGPSGRPSVGSPALVGPTQAQEGFQKHAGDDMASYKQQLDARTAVGGTIMQTLTEARDALGNIKPGGGASQYAKIAQFAQAMGVRPDLVDKIANGDLASSQEFNKLMVNTTMGQIREQLQGVGASRLSQMEFQAFNQNNPNIDTDPRAINKIFDFWTKLYTRDHAEQTGFNEHLKNGGDVLEWPAKWQDIAQKRGYIQPMLSGETGKPAQAPGAGGPNPGDYKSSAAVINDIRSGKLTKAQGLSILNQNWPQGAPAAPGTK